MNNDKRKFWITCPKCKHKFGVEPELIFKYLDRLLGQVDRQLERNKERMKKGESE